MLLEQRVNTSRRDQMGKAAIEAARTQGHEEIVKLLEGK